MCKSGICNLSRSRDSSGSKLRERRRPSENNLEDSSLCVMVLPEVVTVLAGSGVLDEGMSFILVVTMDNTHAVAVSVIVILRTEVVVEVTVFAYRKICK